MDKDYASKEAFEKAFSEAYRAHLQRKADTGILGDVTELMWMVWQRATAAR